MPSLLEVSDVSVTFGAHRALDSVDLVAERGQITGLIGPNGAGKSTLFDVICGLRRPGTGRVVLDGEEITKLGPAHRARKGMARTFQGLELFGRLSVRDNLRVAADIRMAGGQASRLVDEIIDRVRLGAYADRLADSLPTGVGRLVEVARALTTEPRLILLDEPAAGQDPDETDRFAEILRKVAADGVGVMLVEHDMELVMGVCDTVHVLDLGAIISSGTPDEIRQHTAVLDAYLGAS
ncbi:ABC transporter ATP-binding protein [Gordonia rhizosphera]|uniref:Putative ABC transporter ATP-binding protein n=1 Tax=Gordonia rhizosphera NBRC 16068 TaxID=1108045 RepID=K6W7I4_9ACTN|nr:ABC transporter ATP-binding protein [Gordonia rhizosphera]GAB89681.1 putative ABC transporter ATP-binding protein [Gordonia rhizosphera NBRC 16068]